MSDVDGWLRHVVYALNVHRCVCLHNKRGYDASRDRLALARQSAGGWVVVQHLKAGRREPALHLRVHEALRT